MALNLFKFPENKKDSLNKSDSQKRIKTCNFGECLVDLLPAKCRCKKSRRARKFEKARSIMEKEINIIEIIRAQRYF